MDAAPLSPHSRRPALPLALKIGAASFLVVALTASVILTIEYREQRHDIEQSTGDALLRIAGTAALFLNGDDHEAIRTLDDADRPAYARLKKELVRVQHANGLEDYDLLTLRPTGAGAFELVLGLRETPVVGVPYEPPPEVRGVLNQVLRDGVGRAAPMYIDHFGSFVSAFAPIHNGSGVVVGLLEADNDISLVLEKQRMRLVEQIAIGFGALLAALLLSIGFARSITRPVFRLIRAMTAIDTGNYEVQVTVDSRDEIGVLSQVFNSMVGGLRERLAMLRFVPRHTRALIARAVQTQHGELAAFEARKQDLAVLFSDIRGFTALSDELPPDRIIAMLNLYLRHESQIIERHGGSIDKFIGDAVMAIFDGPERFANAADAALEIQRELQALNDAASFERPIRVGIGISGGEVVMGSVGSADRMELAVIGRLVNLAARLTSAAGPGEILISEAVFRRLEAEFGAEPRGTLKLKGFAEGEAAYRLIGRHASAGVPAAAPLA